MQPQLVMRYRIGVAACTLGMAACRSNHEAATSPSTRGGSDTVENAARANDPSPTPASASSSALPSAASAAAQPTPLQPRDVTFPPDWCDRAVPDPYDALAMVATSYIEAQLGSCATAKLIQSLSDAQTLAWGNYLIDYSHALAGCMIPDSSLGGRGFLPGGIDQFGPANLAAIDAPQPRLGRDDANLLIDQYLGAFAASIPMSGVERASVRSFLAAAAQPQIDELVTATLSECNAGSGGG